MDWVRIGDVCKIINGFAFKSKNYVDSGIRVIRIANVQKGLVKDNTPVFYPIDSEGIEKYMLEEGDLLLSLTGNVGRVAILEKEFLPAALNQRVACLRMKSEIISKRYLFHILNSDFFEQQCIQSAKGVAQKNISTEWLMEYKIPLYPHKKQREIADILDNVLTNIQEKKKQLDILDTLIKARFVEMFGLPGTDTHGWGLYPLGKCCVLNPRKGSDPRLSEGLKVSFVPMSAVSESGYIDASEVRMYDIVKTGFTYFAENDVLFAKITPCMENGKGAIAIGLTNEIGFGSTEFHVLRPIKSKSNPYWLYTLISFKSFRKEAEANMTGTAGQRRVPSIFLEKFRVSLPPIKLQEQFAAFVTQVDKSKVIEAPSNSTAKIFVFCAIFTKSFYLKKLNFKCTRTQMRDAA